MRKNTTSLDLYVTDVLAFLSVGSNTKQPIFAAHKKKLFLSGLLGDFRNRFANVNHWLGEHQLWRKPSLTMPYVSTVQLQIHWNSMSMFDDQDMEWIWYAAVWLHRKHIFFKGLLSNIRRSSVLFICPFLTLLVLLVHLVPSSCMECLYMCRSS